MHSEVSETIDDHPQSSRPNAAHDCYEQGKRLSMHGRHAEALHYLQAAIELNPDWAPALNSLGIAHIECGHRAEAERAFRRALALQPDLTEAHCNLGSILIDSNRLDEAAHSFREALRLAPQFDAARIALGKLLAQLGHADEAIDQLSVAAPRLGSDIGTLVLLGRLLTDACRFAEAEPLFRRVVDQKPHSAAAQSNLGIALLQMGRVAAAEVHLRRALELDPCFGVAAYNLTVALRTLRKLDEAEITARRTVELNPMFSGAFSELGNVLLAKNSGDIEEALNAYRRSVEIDPDNLPGHVNLAYVRNFNCDDGYEVLAECRRFAQRFETPYLATPVRYPNERMRARRLRVGYVSPDFRHHCQALFMMPLLRHHDPDAIEVYCYSSVRDRDEMTERLATFADVWRDVHHLNDAELASRIMDDRIDVLVDLTMHMSAGRPQLFARRPAPVQIAWLAYPGTTGSRAIGYRLTDPWLDPDPAEDDRYSERTIRLPDTFWCYDQFQNEIEVGALPADSAGHITFGCLNNPLKLTDRAFALWAAVMRRVDRSRLLALVAEGGARANVRAKFAALGVDPARLEFVDYQTTSGYLRTYQQIDIAFDTFPYNGHTTNLDALWMGVPFATIVGRTPASRASYSLLSNLGMPELVTYSDAAFVETLVELATDLPRLRALRAGLRERMTRSPLMDGARFARGIEQAYRSAWSEWCDSTDAASN